MLGKSAGIGFFFAEFEQRLYRGEAVGGVSSAGGAAEVSTGRELWSYKTNITKPRRGDSL